MNDPSYFQMIFYLNFYMSLLCKKRSQEIVYFVNCQSNTNKKKTNKQKNTTTYNLIFFFSFVLTSYVNVISENSFIAFSMAKVRMSSILKTDQFRPSLLAPILPHPQTKHSHFLCNPNARRKYYSASPAPELPIVWLLP